MPEHGRRGSNPRQPVLETGTLPTELLPYFAVQRKENFLNYAILIEVYMCKCLNVQVCLSECKREKEGIIFFMFT